MQNSLSSIGLCVCQLPLFHLIYLSLPRLFGTASKQGPRLLLCVTVCVCVSTLRECLQIWAAVDSSPPHLSVSFSFAFNPCQRANTYLISLFASVHARDLPCYTKLTSGICPSLSPPYPTPPVPCPRISSACALLLVRFRVIAWDMNEEPRQADTQTPQTLFLSLVVGLLYKPCCLLLFTKVVYLSVRTCA